MLLKFSVQNYRSIKTRQEFSMIPAHILDNEDALIFDNGSYENSLSAAVMYGPNASGKTSFIRALSTMRKMVLNSLKDDSTLLDFVQPFMFDSITPHEPTVFNIIIIVNNLKYEYGFSADRTRVIAEWLYVYPRGRSNKIFTRKYNEDSKSYEYYFPRASKALQKDTVKITDQNSLFISASMRTSAAQYVRDVFEWFDNTLIIIGVDGVDDYVTTSMINDGVLDKLEVIKYLRSAGIELSDIDITEVPLSEILTTKNMPSELKQKLIDKLKNETQLKTNITHSIGEDSYVLSMEDESSGTKRLYGYSAPIIHSLSDHKVLFVDELNSNLHSNLVKHILQSFMNRDVNKFKSQLFFTTHDTSILNGSGLRRDQIWFCDRCQDLATTLYGLLDFKIRTQRNYEHAYLDGKFLAVPKAITKKHKIDISDDILRSLLD